MYGAWGYGPMAEEMPWGRGYGMMYGMHCPACGKTMYEPTKEELVGMLEHRKRKLERALEHINMEIEKLKEQKTGEEHRHEEHHSEE
jgi:hypothetical protein